MRLLHGDCLELMAQIPDGSVDMILCDLPYGTTACKWDSVIPFEPLWANYKRVIKKNGAIVLTATQPFSALVVSSNVKGFKHEWIWQKEKGVGFQIAKYRPMQEHESCLVFTSNGDRVTYFPIKEMRDKPQISSGASTKSGSSPLANIAKQSYVYVDKFPTSIKRFKRDKDKIHPTQKPVALMEYLIRTYTDEGETVLDNCMGSGTTGVACVNTRRNFIGIEKDDKYFAIAQARIEAALPAPAPRNWTLLDLFGAAA